MLYYVSGKVAILEPGMAVIDCNGVGYGCRVTAYTASQLKLNQNARLYVTESIREDAYDLYGFINREEQRCYELLTSVNGVGPKAAMAILSHLTPEKFALAVCTDDKKTISKANGIGPKTAARVILELKDKLMKEAGGSEAFAAVASPVPGAVAAKGGKLAEATDALMVLGYSRAEAMAAMKDMDIGKMELEEIIRLALKRLM